REGHDQPLSDRLRCQPDGPDENQEQPDAEPTDVYAPGVEIDGRGQQQRDDSHQRHVQGAALTLGEPLQLRRESTADAELLLERATLATKNVYPDVPITRWGAACCFQRQLANRYLTLPASACQPLDATAVVIAGGLIHAPVDVGGIVPQEPL